MKTINRYIDAIKGNIEFRLGQNAQENFDLIDASRPDDIWFHISGQSSGHVIASIPEGSNYDKKTIRRIIIQGGIICKQFSRLKSEKDVNVIYSRVKNLVKTEKVGSVSIEEYKLLTV